MEPFASLATLTKFDVPRVLLNREVVGLFKHQRRRVSDVVLTGDLTQLVGQLVKTVGWERDLFCLTDVEKTRTDLSQLSSDSFEKISPSKGVLNVAETNTNTVATDTATTDTDTVTTETVTMDTIATDTVDDVKTVTISKLVNKLSCLGIKCEDS